MKVSILGCSANRNSDGGTTSFLVNESLLIDAGTVTEALTPERVLGLTHVFVSHSHMDHIKGLYSLADYRFLMGASGLTIAGSFAAVDSIARNIFNNSICPDFTSFPAHDPIIVFESLETGRFVDAAGVAVKLIPVAHTVPCTGFLVKEGTKSFMFTGDSGPTDQFWEIARDEKGVAFVIADVSFPNRLNDLSILTGHMTPEGLLTTIRKYGLENRLIYASHLKPPFAEEIGREITAMNGAGNIRILERGSTLYI